MTSVPDASTFITLDNVASDFQIYTANVAHVGTYQVQVTATIAQETFPGSGVNMSSSFSFAVTVVDGCDGVTVATTSIEDQVRYAWSL